MKKVVIFRKDTVFQVVSVREWKKKSGEYPPEVKATARFKNIPRTTFHQMRYLKGRVPQRYLRAVWGE